MDIRLIAMDLDGTALLPDQTSFSPRLEAALLAAHRRGIAIIPATGRQYTLLPPPVGEARPAWGSLAVLCNGAEIRRLADGTLLASRYMAAEPLLPVIRAAEALEIPMELSSGGTIYLTEESWKREARLENARFHQTILARWGRAVEHLESFAAGSGLSFEKASLIFPSQAQREAMEPYLESLPLSCVMASPWSMEITHPEATKAGGVREAGRILGIGMEHVLALGDSGNDIPLLVQAGLGVAMGSAAQAVKDAADAVTAPNTEDGAALAIERYVLQSFS